jgi:hypothetical protein
VQPVYEKAPLQKFEPRRKGETPRKKFSLAEGKSREMERDIVKGSMEITQQASTI